MNSVVLYNILEFFTEEIILVFLLMLSVFGQSTTVSLDVPIQLILFRSS